MSDIRIEDIRAEVERLHRELMAQAAYLRATASGLRDGSIVPAHAANRCELVARKIAGMGRE